MRFTCLVLMLLVFAPGMLRAQVGNWLRVERLPPGAVVTVTTWHRAPCVVQGVDDGGVECLFRGRVYWVDRARILRVSEPRIGAGAILGTAAGALTGEAVAEVLDSPNDSAKARWKLVSAALGGCIGFVIGRASNHRELVLYDAGTSFP